MRVECVNQCLVFSEYLKYFRYYYYLFKDSIIFNNYNIIIFSQKACV